MRIAAAIMAVWAALGGIALAQEPPAREAPGAGILILGDSNSEGPFGGVLYDTLRARTDPLSGKPLAVSIFAKCGAGAIDWIDRERALIDCGAWTCDEGRAISDCHHFMGGSIPPLPQLYRKLGAPRVVTLVILGLNMVIGNQERRLAEAGQLIEKIHDAGSACVWIGPPQAGDGFVATARFDRFVRSLRQVVTAAGCRFIASDNKTDRHDVGVHSHEDHYPPAEARQWADAVIHELDHPVIPAERPLASLLASPLGPKHD